MNGQAFVNFSAFLGDPKDVHFQKGAGNWNRNQNPENVRDSSETLMHTSLYFSKIEEEMQNSEMDSSSILDQQIASREEDPVLETERTQWESAGLPQVLSDQDRRYHNERTEFINVIIGRHEEEVIDLMALHGFGSIDMARHYKKSRKIRKEIRKHGRRKKNHTTRRLRKVKERAKSLEEWTRQQLWTARRSTASGMRRRQHQEGKQQRDVETKPNLHSSLHSLR